MKRISNISISFHDQDENHLNSIVTFLSPIASKLGYNIFHKNEIPPGEKISSYTSESLAASPIIILLISKHYLEQNPEEYETIKTMAKNDRSLKVIPIILGTCMWQYDNFLKDRQHLPKYGKSLHKVDFPDDFWNDIANSLAKLLKKINNLNEDALDKKGSRNLDLCYYSIPTSLNMISRSVRAGRQGEGFSQEPELESKNILEFENISSTASTFQVKGDSMAKKFQPGDHIICEQVYGEDNTFVRQNEEKLKQIKIQVEHAQKKNKRLAFVIAFTNQEPLLKYIKKVDFASQIIVLESHNPEYSDESFPLSEVSGIWKVKKKLSISDID